MTETISAEIISAVLQMKRMTSAQWRTSQYVPRQGEPVCESDTGFMKVGDGVHRFSDLRYLTGPPGPQGVQGVQGPPGRDGVVTFENLSQSQRNSLKGDRGEPGPRGLQGPPGPTGARGADGQPGQRGADGARGATGERGPAGERGATGERGHSLNAGVRIEGTFRNGVNSQLNVMVDVYYDGVKVTSGYTTDFYYRGFGNDNWSSLLNRRADTNGKVAEWSRAQRSGEYLEVYVIVTYNDLKAVASTRIDNIRDGARGENGVAGATGPAGQPGQNIINQKTGQPMKYWVGSKAEFDAISNKDAGTVYDYYE